jgi:hypothetical protein
MDQNEFIKRCGIMHNQLYDYSNTVFINTRTNVNITCPIHGVFKQRANHHLHGRGCKQCGYNRISKSRVVKFDTFIKRLVKKHGKGMFDTNNIEDTYVDMLTPINIQFIPTGRIFTQSPNYFLKNNLSYYSNFISRDTETFIERCRQIHGNTYDYSVTKYMKATLHVDIICKIHGMFSQLASVHLSGCGCKKCNLGKVRKTTDEFIVDAKKIHGDVYDYTKSIYTHSHKPIVITCKKHGDFEIIATNHIKGHGCLTCSYYDTDIFVDKSNKKHNKKYDYTKSVYTKPHDKLIITCPIHGDFRQNAYQHLAGQGCAKCANQFSTQHESIKYLLQTYDIKFLENERSLISPLELDFYLPDYNLAIEVNGIFWHSELRGKDRKYHLNKTDQCKDNKIKLLHINENEFINSSDIVISKLKSILNISKKPIFGRKCEVKEIDTKVKSKFLKKYHLQGNDKAFVKLGLFYNDKLVSVMTFCKRRVALGKKTTEEGEYELSRYCGIFNFYVIGGASKLLKHFERNYNPSKIVTYADKRWSTGDVYYKMGFTHTHDSKPNYWYFSKNNQYKLFHRFNFRKSELHKKLETFDPKLTEWENMKNNGWNRIWDCGNMVFEKLRSL